MAQRYKFSIKSKRLPPSLSGEPLLCCDYTSTTQQNISQHVDNIYKDGELIVEATNKKFLLVRQEGNRKVKRNIDYYNLDMIIALGSRTVERAINF